MEMVQVPVVAFTCPSRRTCVLHPVVSAGVNDIAPNYGFYPPV